MLVCGAASCAASRHGLRLRAREATAWRSPLLCLLACIRSACAERYGLIGKDADLEQVNVTLSEQVLVISHWRNG